MRGSLTIHLEIDKVQNLKFSYSGGNMTQYDNTVNYYTKKYGTPVKTDLNFDEYYPESAVAFWYLDDGSVLCVNYHASKSYYTAELSVEIYR